MSLCEDHVHGLFSVSSFVIVYSPILVRSIPPLRETLNASFFPAWMLWLVLPRMRR